MQRRPSVRIVGIGIAVIVFAFIVWMGVRESVAPTTSESTGTTVTVGTTVSVVVPPIRSRAKEPVGFTWTVHAPIGSTATHTAIHWGAVAHPGVLGADVTPAVGGYPNALPTYAAGTFVLPREFSGSLTFPTRGTYFYRAHAVVDGKNVWSAEHSIVIQ
ncbi:hypothetical protein HY480_03025 [Candidatus Uhrbacteria bacterium]|nr:hypothetical protein [Candidatus Uhrbacteria bacterium]